MNSKEECLLFERLSDLELPLEERMDLERLIATEPELSERYATYRLLEEWAELESQTCAVGARSEIYESLLKEKESDLADRELGRLFPIFLGGALAASLVVALLNFWQFSDTSAGSVEALFGIPAESMETIIVSQL
tara:strand:- start:422 stop:829 length:408 start_codon:yes stop_codon:yes gene_type:complete